MLNICVCLKGCSSSVTFIKKKIATFWTCRHLHGIVFGCDHSQKKAVNLNRSPLPNGLPEVLTPAVPRFSRVESAMVYAPSAFSKEAIISFSAARCKNKRTAKAVLLFLLTTQNNSDLFKHAGKHYGSALSGQGLRRTAEYESRDES